jgi:two-component system cell cycle sensor histidine kinase/response regulator CckA
MGLMPLRVLLVEDNPADVRLVLHELRQSGFDPVVARAENAEDFLTQLSRPTDIILCDYNLPQFDAQQALELLKRSGLGIPLLIVSGSIGEEIAVQTIKQGATDYLLKDRLGRLGPAVRQALEQSKLREAEVRAREALRASEEQLQAFFDTTNAGMAVANYDGRLVRVNDAYCRMLGYSRHELLDMSVGDLLFAEDRPRVQREYERLISRAIVELQGERRYRRKDGSTLLAEVNLVGIHGLPDAPIRIAAVALDVTDRKRAEEALQEREFLLRNIIANIPCAVFWKDRDSVYLGCNDRLAHDNGQASAALVIGRSDRDLGIDPGEAEFFRQCDRRVMETGESILNLEETLTRPDGSKALLMTSKVPMRDAAGNIVGLLGVYQDITDRKKLEEQYRQSQKMEAVGQLAGGIAHDFNNLLTVINGYSDILLSQCSPVDPVRGPLEEIHQAGERAATLTAQLLAFSRKTIVAPKIIDLNEVIEQIVKLLTRLIGDDIKLVTSLAADLSLVKADRSQLEQVIMNLAVNARDAMPKGGRLAIETRDLEVDSATTYADCPPGRYVRLAVSDTGCGMTAEVKEKIFEPFFTTKGPGKGTGLGLATVYGIVKQAGGAISLSSDVNVGTTFHVLLPAVPDEREPAGAPGTARPAKGCETILLVEDEPGVRLFACQALQSQGYSVLQAGNAREALEASDRFSGTIHLLVTDVVMAETGGRDLADELRSRRPGIGVLYMSGYTDDVVIRHGVIEANDAFLQKPFTPLGLSRKVRSVLDAPSLSESVR